jgi:hydroxyacylglutathione hydrolase
VLDDNYSYLLVDPNSNLAAAVDPVEPLKVLQVVKEQGLELAMVLTTHFHGDHAGGNKEMAKMYPGIEIVGGVGDNVAACTREVCDFDIIELGNTQITVFFAPCHTPGHVMYFAKANGHCDEHVLFTGDTLFVAGCGNFNSGTPNQMVTNFDRIKSLPEETKVS